MKFYISTMQENLPSSKIIYMRRTGKYGSENYELMDTFKKWIQENNLYNEDTVIYAIPMDNPEIVDPFQCRYDVCIMQPTIYKFALKQIQCRELEGGKYLTFLGSVKNFVALVKNGSFLVRITDMTILIEKEFIYGSSKRPNPTDYYRK